MHVPPNLVFPQCTVKHWLSAICVSAVYCETLAVSNMCFCSVLWNTRCQQYVFLQCTVKHWLSAIYVSAVYCETLAVSKMCFCTVLWNTGCQQYVFLQCTVKHWLSVKCVFQYTVIEILLKVKQLKVQRLICVSTGGSTVRRWVTWCMLHVQWQLHLGSCVDSKFFYICRTWTFCMTRAFNFVISLSFFVSSKEVKDSVALNTPLNCVCQ